MRPGAIAFGLEREQAYLVSVVGRLGSDAIYSGRPELVRLEGREEDKVLSISPMPRGTELGTVRWRLTGEVPEGLNDRSHADARTELVPVTGSSWGSQRYTVEDPQTGMTLLSLQGLDRGHAAREVDLPPGQYRVAPRLMCDRTETMSPMHGEGRVNVRVRPGNLASVSISVGALSRIQTQFKRRPGLLGSFICLSVRDAHGEER